MPTRADASSSTYHDPHATADSARTRAIVDAVCDWFDDAARPLPWRSGATSPWGILVSEVLSHQTQIARVVPKWLEFMRRWPEPAALAADSDAAILEFWDRLGYPRRALQLRRCAIMICDEHGGSVPSTVSELLALPGVGPYTAGAVASFAFHQPVAAVDTNVRRVLARAILGDAQAWRPSTVRDETVMRAVLPRDGARAAKWNAASMELGALICRARTPDCRRCPIVQRCAWQQRGCPASDVPQRPSPSFKGSLREARGRVMKLLREHPTGAELPEVESALSYQQRFDVQTVVSGLVVDGLAHVDGKDRMRLGPGSHGEKA